MTLQDWGALATSTNAILTLLTLVVGAIFSRKLWRGVKSVTLSIAAFVRGIAAVGDMGPQLSELPAQLTDTNTRIAGLDAAFRARTDQNTAVNDRLADLTESMTRIDKQLNPNGGGSMHDAVTRIATDLKHVQHNLHVVSGVMRISWDQLGNFGTFYAASDGAWTYASALMLRWCNRAMDDFAGRGWINCIHPADRNAVVAEWFACVSDKRIFQVEFRMICEDELFNVSCNANPLKDASGEVTMWVGMIQRGQVVVAS